MYVCKIVEMDLFGLHIKTLQIRYCLISESDTHTHTHTPPELNTEEAFKC